MRTRTQFYTRKTISVVIAICSGWLLNAEQLHDNTIKHPAEQSNQEIEIWPKSKTVYLPTDLEQFMFMEFPKVENSKNLTIKLTLPDGIIIKSYPTASSWAVLPKKHIRPEKTETLENVTEITISSKDAKTTCVKTFWLNLSIEVKCPPGQYSLVAELLGDGKILSKRAFDVKVYSKLKNVKFKQLKAIAWHYNGLDKAYVPTYVDMLRASGINTLAIMRGEGTGNEKKAIENSVSDYALSRNMELILVFFIHDVIEYAIKEHQLTGKNSSSISWLLDHPKVFKKILKNYIDAATKGKNYTGLLHDAETHALVHGTICGDLTGYGIEAFRKEAKIDEKCELTPQIIKEKYSKEWVSYRCSQTNRINEVLRELIDETWPERQFHTYSGYEFNESPYKDRTRRLYGVDWKSLADTGIDYADTGYGGSMDQIRATRDALAGKAILIPAEMRIVNFLSKHRIRQTPEQWSMRLITSFLNSGMKGGLSIWYGNDLEGGALIAMNKAFDFMRQIEPFALKGKRADDAVKVSPMMEKDNVYVLRKGGNSLIIAVNPDDMPKTLRVRLLDFTLKGHTSNLEIKDMATGKQIPPKRVLKVELSPYSYRIFNLLDDGN